MADKFTHSNHFGTDMVPNWVNRLRPSFLPPRSIFVLLFPLLLLVVQIQLPGPGWTFRDLLIFMVR